MKYIYILIILCLSCSKDPSYIFNVDDVNITQNSAEKTHLKTDLEFISIAYTDLFNSTINQDDLENIIFTYKSFGDKTLIIQMIIKKFLDDANNAVATIDRSSKESISDFVENSYVKLFNRKPDALEKWHFTEIIYDNNNVTSKIFYYALMTSDEYRYY